MRIPVACLLLLLAGCSQPRPVAAPIADGQDAQRVRESKQRAREHIELGELEHALADLERALSLCEASSLDERLRILDELADLCATLRRQEHKLGYLDQALGLGPDDPWRWYARGVALQELGRSDEALESFDRALALDPTHAKSLQWRGEIHALWGRHSQAVADFERALDLIDTLELRGLPEGQDAMRAELLRALEAARDELRGRASHRRRASGSDRYHADPEHPWNRLHAALARRTTSGGREVGLGESDLLLWSDSQHLLARERLEELLAALEAFAVADGDGWLHAPLARVLMQQDLWQAFDWCVAGLSEAPAPRRPDAGGVVEEPRMLLARALARALARVAPTADELAGLPDNLAEAVDAWQGARAPDAAGPRTPFLPDVEWVRVGDPFGQPTPLARQHAETFAGRAAFEVRLAVPGGREATRAWLATLGDSSAVTVACGGGACGSFDERAGKHHLHLSPDLPSPPPGTVVALVRRVVAFDDAGQLHVTSLVESVQLRGFLEAPEDAVDVRTWEAPAGWPWQAFAELALDPKGLLDGEAGGLRAILPGEHAFVLLGSHGDPVAHLPDDFDAPGTGRHLDSCAACHGIVGALSLVSFTRVASGPGTQLSVPLRELPPRLVEVDARAIDARALRFKRARFDWGLLWSLLAEERARR